MEQEEKNQTKTILGIRKKVFWAGIVTGLAIIGTSSFTRYMDRPNRIYERRTQNNQAILEIESNIGEKKTFYQFEGNYLPRETIEQTLKQRLEKNLQQEKQEIESQLEAQMKQYQSEERKQ